MHFARHAVARSKAIEEPVILFPGPPAITIVGLDSHLKLVEIRDAQQTLFAPQIIDLI